MNFLSDFDSIPEKKRGPELLPVIIESSLKSSAIVPLDESREQFTHRDSRIVYMAKTSLA